MKCCSVRKNQVISSKFTIDVRPTRIHFTLNYYCDLLTSSQRISYGYLKSFLTVTIYLLTNFLPSSDPKLLFEVEKLRSGHNVSDQQSSSQSFLYTGQNVSIETSSVSTYHVLER